MDIKIWENTVITWVNLLSGSVRIESVNQINESVLEEVIKKINLNYKDTPVEFLKKIFPNLTESDVFKLDLSIDYLCALTLLLIYVSLSGDDELQEVKNQMCCKLNTTIQLNIVEFLNDMQEYDNVFNFSFKQFKEEIFPQKFFNFKEKHYTQTPVIGDCVKTPVKNDQNNSFDSPLQGFFQTPKRNVNAHTKCSYSLCGSGDHIKHIKKLTDQLVEEELEKTLLQEQLNLQMQKCNDYEMKLKNKIEEVNHLKEEWEKESKKNEDEVSSLKNTITKKLESEKKFKSDVSHLENYAFNLETDLSNSLIKNNKLENELQTILEKFTANEAQLKETTELCAKLQIAISEKEKELEQFKENYANFYNDEKSIDVSFMNRSSDISICPPENLGVVVDKLLREKTEENVSLQETVENLRQEKDKLIDELKSLNEQLEMKCSIVAELQFLIKELNSKVDNFNETEKQLFETQNQLISANAEITKLNKENSHLLEKYNILNSRLQEREKVLINCNNSKMLLQINFLKLLEDFKAVQQRLDLEVKRISDFVQKNCENVSSQSFGENDFAEVYHMKDSKDNINVKTLDNSQNELNCGGTKALVTSFADDKLCKLAELLQDFESQIEWTVSKASFQKTYNQLNDNVIVLKSKLRELEEYHKISLEAKSKLEKQLNEAEQKLTKIQTSNSIEISSLKQDLKQKENKITELEDLIRRSKKIEEDLLREKEVLMQETKVLMKTSESKIDHEGGDNKKTRSVSFGNVPAKVDEKPSEHQEFSDSLEEVPVVNKTFDIVNLEEKNVTFSIKKDVEASDKNNKNGSAWVVSPPSKVPLKILSKEAVRRQDNRRVLGESWVVSINSESAKESKVKKVSSSSNGLATKNESEKIVELRKEITEFSKECERLKSALLELEQKRKKDKEAFEKNQEIIRQSITTKYENQLEHLKNEMKQLYNRELAKHKAEQSDLNAELKDQNKRYKEHIDELRNQLWDLGEKLLQEQTLKRDLERNYCELKEKYENLMFSKKSDEKNYTDKILRQKEPSTDETVRTSSLRHIPNLTFPTIPTEDEDEIFDNRFLEDMKMGVCKTERPEERLKELQYRNSLCLPHLKSSYPGETQFHNPTLFKESELKFGFYPFAQESQSLTDSDHSMTRSLLPDNKPKKKEQTSYKRPGPPTPSKNGARLSIQSGDIKLTPRNVLKELNDQNERNKGTPNPLKLLLTSRNVRRGSTGGKDENVAPVTPRKKKFFRKPFGVRDH